MRDQGDGERIIELWRRRGLYRWNPDPRAHTFSAVIPAPNATGDLHIGHALNLSLQDILCRWHRIEGREILWAGAVDHGSFSTQTVVEREMSKRGVSARCVPPEDMKRAIDGWIATISPRIFEQIQALGVLADIDGQASMADAFNDELITGYFIELHRKGLVYEAEAVVDWCPSCRTFVDKVDQVSRTSEGVAYHLRYMAVDDPHGSLEVATTTPETLHADVALVAAAGDPGYARLFGRSFRTALGGPVPLLPCEELPGGGDVMRVTPAHCAFSHRFARGKGLRAHAAFDASGVMISGPSSGETRERARSLAIDVLARERALVGQEGVATERPSCRKCGSFVEAFPSTQWLLAVEPLLQPTLDLFRAGKVSVYPRRYELYCKAWLDRCLKARSRGSCDELGDDWCVTRQIQCGNTIPVQRCGCGGVRVGRPGRPCPVCGGPMDPATDVIDMKLADALWAFCANRRYTTDALELKAIGERAACVTGLDLLLYWIMPILMLSTQLEDPLPFRDVVIHPIVCDATGRKMGKSIGNVVPLTGLLEEYGADCLRLSLLDGLDLSAEKVPFSREKLEDNRRLVDALLASGSRLAAEEAAPASPPGSARLADIAARIRTAISRYEFSALHPEVREVIRRLDEQAQPSAPGGRALLREALVLLHPFVPVTSELLWCAAFPDAGLLATFSRTAGRRRREEP